MYERKNGKLEKEFINMRVKKQMTTIELGIHDVLTGIADDTA